MFDEQQKTTIVAAISVIAVCQLLQAFEHFLALHDLAAIWNAIYNTHR